MHVALACGGTGGHIFPGLATAEELKARGRRVTLWLTGRDLEKEAAAGWEGPVQEVPAQGFPRRVSIRLVAAAWRLLRARKTCLRLMTASRPDVVLAMGSYASAGPVSAALRLGIPVVLHEANVVPGKAVSLFASRASAVAASFEETRFYLNRRDIVVTGMPIRRELLEGHAPASGRPRGEPVNLLIMGGSRGAHVLNCAVVEALASMRLQPGACRVAHLAGHEDEAMVRERYAEAGVRAEVKAFEHNMTACYRNADLAVCRAGASTCAELGAFGVPALLVPYPHAVRDHQMKNARALERAGAADVVPEKDLSAAWLSDYFAQAVRDRERLERMRAAARRRNPGDAARALADLVEQQAMPAGA